MSPLPSPTAPTKRRYEQTPLAPSTNGQRSLAPNAEMGAMDEEASILSTPKPSHIDEFVPPNPSIALQRSTSNEMAQKPRVQHQSPAQNNPILLPHRRPEESLQALRPQTSNQQRHLPGPPSGFFTEDRSEP